MKYPTVAIREATPNTLIHRDYNPFTEESAIQINFFKIDWKFINLAVDMAE